MNEKGTNFSSFSVGTASYAEVAGSSPTEKQQKFVPFSFIHNPLYLYLIDSVDCPSSYACLISSTC